MKRRRYTRRKDSLGRKYVLDTKTGRRAKITLYEKESKRRKKAAAPRRIKERFVDIRDKRIAQLEKQLKDQAEFFKTVVREQIQPYSKLVALENLPEKQVNETDEEHAKRIVLALVRQGQYTADESYRAVAEHTGMRTSEIYTMFMYLSTYGEYVA